MTDLHFKNCKLMTFPKYGDEDRGFLTFFEAEKGVPFRIQRVYYIYGIGDANQVRGPHAHKNTDQIFINVVGHAAYHLDDGESTTTVVLTEPNNGIFIGKEIWHYMTDFSERAVILVIASSHYNESDYLREYEGFLKYINK